MTYPIGRFTEGCNKTQNRKEDALYEETLRSPSGSDNDALG